LKNIGGLGDFAARRMGGNAKEKGILIGDRSVTDSVNDEESAGLVVRHLERLMGQWQGVLQEVVYDRVIGYLLEGVLKATMRPILETDCVTESAGIYTYMYICIYMYLYKFIYINVSICMYVINITFIYICFIFMYFYINCICIRTYVFT
jgi:hypothetical protein